MDLYIALISVAAAFGIGFLFAAYFAKRPTQTEPEDKALENQLKAIAAEALRNNNESFLQLAEQKFKNLHQHSESELEKREKAVENLVKPIQDALKEARSQMQHIETQRKKEYGSLHQQIEMTMQAQQSLREETGKLVQALKQPQVRGRWGEITLRRLAELAGMAKHCDFDEQVHITNEAGNHLRPDMIVKLPNERFIIVDAKTSINAYLNALEAKNEDQREAHLERHAQNMRERIKELSSKAYWREFENSLEFVILFVPGDQFLAAALDRHHDLIEQALSNKIILATPSSLIAVLRAVEFGWREKSLAENAAEIQNLGKTLSERISVFVGYFDDLGRLLNKSVSKYNQAHKSMETRLIHSAHKLADLGVPQSRTLPETNQIDNRAGIPENDGEA